MTEYIHGVCNKLSTFHGILAFFSITIAGVYGLGLFLAVDYAKTHDAFAAAEEDIKKTKHTLIFALGITLYNVLLFIFIPTF